MQLGIFNSGQKDFPEIDGLKYIENFISLSDQKTLLEEIDKEIWLQDLKRRVQHYGYKYDYKRRNIDISLKVGELPLWANELIAKFRKSKLISFPPDQLIVNEYLPGQGIASHIDCEPCFEDTIISLSLGSSCKMDFIKFNKPDLKKVIYLQPGSLLILNGEARYDWLHGIAGRKSDNVFGEKIIRSRRVSLTFRKVILS